MILMMMMMINKYQAERKSDYSTLQFPPTPTPPQPRAILRPETVALNGTCVIDCLISPFLFLVFSSSPRERSQMFVQRSAIRNGGNGNRILRKCKRNFRAVFCQTQRRKETVCCKSQEDKQVHEGKKIRRMELTMMFLLITVSMIGVLFLELKNFHCTLISWLFFLARLQPVNLQNYSN